MPDHHLRLEIEGASQRRRLARERGGLAWGESVFGVVDPIPGCPRLVLPFLAATITSEPADGTYQNLLRESMCYGAYMIANMLEVKKAVKINAPEMPDLVVDSDCIRALTLTITGRRIVLAAHWAVEIGTAPPVYFSRIAKAWEAHRAYGFPIRDALSSIHLAREWIMEVNTERYHNIIRKIYGFFETTCCICSHQELSQGHCTASMAMSSIAGGEPRLAGLLARRAHIYLQHHLQHGQIDELDQAIANLQSAVDLAKSGPQREHLGSMLNMLGVLSLRRYARNANEAVLDDALHRFSWALECFSVSHSQRVISLAGIAQTRANRYDRTGAMLDLEEAISQIRTAIDIQRHFNDTDLLATILSNLGCILWRRYQRTGSSENLHEAFTAITKAAAAVSPDNAGLLGSIWTNLAGLLARQYEITGMLDHLRNAVFEAREVAHAAPESPELDSLLSLLAPEQLSSIRLPSGSPSKQTAGGGARNITSTKKMPHAPAALRDAEKKEVDKKLRNFDLPNLESQQDARGEDQELIAANQGYTTHDIHKNEGNAMGNLFSRRANVVGHISRHYGDKYGNTSPYL
ncbi:hypothetical protein P168DRAFT_321920 [Aspergillus campestris IBT 28561]|uniref:Uncharacterized protein n=1 Tax=Aspergillus campestris (strain IBT 28561) TaxID=1392248 RepID=A0A2I1CTC3_ASPC2|nr:uncharacterized protein P168DRAFT_321920 [Aspergillus campestris IBT 28561]PKY00861.1 hypothetical protein P168DRAFT_321920 [Aspergillus campestris IBT 28561]